jgi:glycerol-3-phosphate dehydrogenase
MSGGVLFYDAQMYSSERLVLEVLQGACDAGAVAANYVEVKAPLRSGGKTIGAQAHDSSSNQGLDIQARVIVNVAGPAAVSLAARFTNQPQPIKTTLSTAMNFVIAGSNHRVAFAVTGSSHDPNVLVHRGGRQLFVTPWRGSTLIGTAHYAYNGDPERFDLDERDVERFLEEVNAALPARKLTVADINLVHRGLLPAQGEGEPVRLAKHPIVIDHAVNGQPNLISALTVKFTTARLLAEQVTDLACARLGRPGLECTTSTTPLPGAPSEPVDELARNATERWSGTLEPDVAEHLVRTYGRQYEAVLDHCKTDLDWDRRLAQGSPVIKAQVIHAIRKEMALSAEDIIARRTELGALGIGSDSVTHQVSSIVETEREATAA